MYLYTHTVTPLQSYYQASSPVQYKHTMHFLTVQVYYKVSRIVLLFVVPIVSILSCAHVYVCISLFGRAVKNWFRVCCFEPSAKCCLTNPLCSENKSFSRSPPTNHSSLLLRLTSSRHNSLPLTFFSCLNLIYLNPSSVFLCSSVFMWLMSAVQIGALHLPYCVIMLSCENAVLLVPWLSVCCTSLNVPNEIVTNKQPADTKYFCG